MRYLSNTWKNGKTSGRQIAAHNAIMSASWDWLDHDVQVRVAEKCSQHALMALARCSPELRKMSLECVFSHCQTSGIICAPHTPRCAAESFVFDLFAAGLFCCGGLSGSAQTGHTSSRTARWPGTRMLAQKSIRISAWATTSAYHSRANSPTMPPSNGLS